MNLRSKLAFFIALNNYVEMIVNGVAPLSLPRAKAKPITKLTAFGGTEQRNLPDGYLQRQFIYMMDESYIDTGIVPDNAGKIEIDFQTTSVQTRNTVYFGTRTNISAGDGITVAHASNGNILIENFGTRYAPSIAFANNTRYSCVFDNGTVVWKSGSTILYTNTSTPTDTTTHSLYINALNNAGTVYGNYEGIYLYSFKVWNAQGVLVADYVPAVQKAAVPVVGFYDTVSGTFKTATSGTFAAGGEAVPTPDTPMDIVSNNGVLRLVPNLWSVYENAYLDASGVAVALSGFGCTDYIPVNAGEKYSFYADVFENYASNGLRICFYDANKTFIPPRQGDNATTVAEYLFVGTAPANAKYMRCSCGTNSSWVRNIMLKKGVWTTSTIKTAVYADGVVETLQLSTLPAGYLETDYSTNSSATSIQTPVYFDFSKNYEFEIRVKAQSGSWYILQSRTSSTGNIVGLAGGNSGSTIIWGVTYESGITSAITRTAGHILYIKATAQNGVLTLYVKDETAGTEDTQTGTYTPDSTVMSRPVFLWGNGFQNVAQDSDVYMVKIKENGVTLVDYIPCTYNGTAGFYDRVSETFKTNTNIAAGNLVNTATAEMLLSLGDYTDEQEIISGVVTRKLGIKVLDGTENWNSGGGGTGVWANFQSITGVAFATTNAFCSHSVYGGANISIVDMNQNEFCLYDNGNIAFKNTYSTSTNDWKNWLATQYAAGTPVIIVYPLAEPTTDTVTGQPMNTTAGDNILEITQASLDGLELECRYFKGK